MTTTPIPIEKLESLANKYLPPRGLARIRHAYQFAKKAHHNQFRKSGNPYIIHPVQVACILAELQQDAYTLAAALLHDTIEDCDVTYADIEAEFGRDTAQLVEGVTKLGKVYFGSREVAQGENLKKMFLAMAKDVRVVLIKLADRLHNMRTLKYLTPDKQYRISSETHDIFAPLAHRLGMWSLKWELDDLAFYYLHPKEFQKIKTYVATKRDQREAYVSSFVDHISALLAKARIEGTVKGRPKHFFSIYNKLKKQNISYDELYDILGIRIIVSSIKECYAVLGICHESFKPIQGRFKDYIAMPKTNMYQSLHTAVIGPEGKPIEIQIRTQDMDNVAQNGIAAHWQYKEGGVHTKFDADFSWLTEILESGKDVFKDSSQASTYLDTVKVDLFMDEVFVFTPDGDVQSLPKGATAIDFAYKIHTEIGHRCIGAKANNQIIPLDKPLQNGDRVSIITGKKENPKLDWLNIVKTGQAGTKIRYWFRKQNAALNIEKGKLEIEKALLLSGYLLTDLLTKPHTSAIIELCHANSLNDLYLKVAHGDISIKLIINYLNKTVKKPLIEPDKTIVSKLKAQPSKPSSDGIRVLGERNIDVRIAQCCRPLPGDDIKGFVTLGFGVSVHRSDCHNILKLSPSNQGRIVTVEWDNSQADQTYSVSMHIQAIDQPGILQEIIAQFGRITIRTIQTFNAKQTDQLSIHLQLELANLSEYKSLKRNLEHMANILSVKRKRS